MCRALKKKRDQSRLDEIIYLCNHNDDLKKTIDELKSPKAQDTENDDLLQLSEQNCFGTSLSLSANNL